MDNEATRAVASVRHFNRFHARRIGVRDEGLPASEFSLAEVRVLCELAHRHDWLAGELAEELALDTGYLSRILGDFERRGFVTRMRAKEDARQRTLALTASGKAALAPPERRSQAEVAAMLQPPPSRAAAALAGSWSSNASGLRANAGIAASRCGRRKISSPRGASIRVWASISRRASRTRSSA